MRGHQLQSVEVVFHGGEPLLAGPVVIDQAASVLRRHMPEGTELELQVVTNGVRLDERVLAVLARHGIRVAISLDGGQAANDRHRRFADGRGSHDVVTRGIGLLRSSHPDLFAGLLSVIDLRNDPVETYEALLCHEPPVIDLSLPHGTPTAPGRRRRPAWTPMTRDVARLMATGWRPSSIAGIRWRVPRPASGFSRRSWRC